MEIGGYKLLEELSLKYQPQFVYGNRYVADAFIESHKLIVQFDGDYWHRNPVVFSKLTSRQQKQKEVDERANKTAISLDYKVIRIWESEMKNRETVKQRLSFVVNGGVFWRDV